MEVAIAVVYSSVVFEWLLPNEGTNFVSDVLDIVAYIFGALLYMFIISKEAPILNQEKSLFKL